MSIAIAGNSAGGYNLTKSLRLRSSASAYLNRTPASASNRRTWTYSGWIKISLGANKILLNAQANSSNGTQRTLVAITNTGNVYVNTDNLNTAFIWDTSTNNLLRDPAAWYHIVVALDTTQAVASNRVRIYINGVEASYASSTYPAQNYDSAINNNVPQYIGYEQHPAQPTNRYDGYMAEVNFIDGQQLTPSSFGSFNSITGVWQPARYTGTYGTNGFYLPFTNTTSTTTLGYDFSGNSNNWTTNNISLTAGTTYDSMNDVPTLTSTTVSNYCVNNAVNTGAVSGWTCSDGNLKFSPTTLNNWCYCLGTFGMSSGKWYWEGTMTLAGEAMFGITASTNYPIFNTPGGWNSTSYAYYVNGQKFTNASGAAYGASWTNGDVIGIAFDADARTLTFYKNGVSQGVAFSSIPAGTYSAQNACNTNGVSGNAVVVNFGQQPFVYTPPTGHLALNTYNLPDSTVPAGNKVMDATLYTGTGNVANTITNASSFKPDLVWIKSRSNGYDHLLYDSVRGTGTGAGLSSNINNVEGANAAYANLTSFNTNGFSVGTTSSTNTLNNSGSTFVSWQWQAGQGTNTTNTSGSITSTVSVNPTAGFSIVTYTGTGANATVGHGLGVTPQFIIVKRRDSTGNWFVYQPNGGNTQFLLLNTTNAYQTNSTIWNNTSPTSSVFSVGTAAELNTSGGTYVAYCWTPIAGFSAFGSYVGNGSTDGPFVYTGFRPKYVLIKNTVNGVTDWTILDAARSPYNVANLELNADLPAAEYTANAVDFLANGFKIRQTYGNTNGSGQTMVYAAFAENPFKNALAR